MRALAAVLAAAISVPAVPASAQEMTGDAAEGQALARQVCAECHNVERGEGPSIRSLGPSFQELARDPTATALSLRVRLRTPHEIMPNLMVSETEADDLVAYILSLR